MHPIPPSHRNTGKPSPTLPARFLRFRYTMEQKCIQTLAEIEENKVVNQIYNNRILLIKELLRACKLTIEDLCVHLDIDKSTYYRWYQNKHPVKIDSHTYIHACIFFKQYMSEHKIPFTEEIIRLIAETELFNYHLIMS